MEILEDIVKVKLYHEFYEKNQECIKKICVNIGSGVKDIVKIIITTA